MCELHPVCSSASVSLRGSSSDCAVTMSWTKRGLFPHCQKAGVQLYSRSVAAGALNDEELKDIKYIDIETAGRIALLL